MVKYTLSIKAVEPLKELFTKLEEATKTGKEFDEDELQQVLTQFTDTLDDNLIEI